MGQGRFARVGDAQASSRGNYFPNLSMTYLISVVAAKVIDTRAKETAFILECEVKKVLVGDTLDAAGKIRVDGDGRSVPSPGEKRSWYCNLSNDAGPADMRKFAEMIFGMLEMEGEMTDKAIEELCEHICDEKENPLAGTLLKVATYNKPTRAKTPFTIHDWFPPSEDDLKAVAA